ncbi:MAG: endonuclease, partial [Bacteroidota bacterium]
PSGTAVVGNATSVVCKVINTATDSVLHVTAANFSGTNAAMFSVSGVPLNVPPHDSSTFTLHFNATGADGSKTATLSLPNNDIDKTPYVLNLWGVKGCCATEPAYPAAQVNFSYVKSFKFRVNFADSTVAPENYLMLKKTSPITEEPLDGHTYLKGDYIGGAQVAYIGDAGYFYPANVVANTHYYIKIFSYNGYPGYENYLTTHVAAIDTSTLPNMIGTYYDAIDPYSPTLWQDLHNLINTHTTLYYSDYDNYMIDPFESRDTVVSGRSQKALTCAYSGENYVYSEPFAFTVFSREHVFCESWMPTYNDANYTSTPEYADYHNLLPVDQNKVNVYRLNYPLGIVDSVTYQYLNCKKGLDAAGHVVFEPRNSEKGDAARAMFYQILCYDGISSHDWYLPQVIDSSSANYGQDEALLKQWSLQDPPDNFEIARNDNIFYWQLNRNPFIDHPEWVAWFGFGVNSGIGEAANNSGFSLYPNPAQGVITLISTQPQEAQFELFDITGALKFSKTIKAITQSTIDLGTCPNGMFFYRLTEKDGKVSNGKLVISN